MAAALCQLFSNGPNPRPNKQEDVIRKPRETEQSPDKDSNEKTLGTTQNIQEVWMKRMEMMHTVRKPTG